MFIGFLQLFRTIQRKGGTHMNTFSYSPQHFGDDPKPKDENEPKMEGTKGGVARIENEDNDPKRAAEEELEKMQDPK